MDVPSEKVLEYHANMIIELRELIATNSKEWDDFCSQLVDLRLISPADMGDVKSMHDVFKFLMKKGKIKYGKYKKLRDVFGKNNEPATRIINKYTELIDQEKTRNGIENIDESQAGFSQLKSADRKTPFGAVKRKSGPSGDRELENESKLGKGKRLKGKNKRSIDSGIDTTGGNRDSKRRKGYPNHSHDSDDSDHRTEADGRGSNRREGKAGNLRKEYDDTHSARIIYTWQKAMDAVGLIEGPAYSGTGFRVGKDKIMTAFHVVKDITRPRKDDEYCLSNIKKDNVFITFNFLERNDSKNTRKFHFEKLCCYDRAMDFAILQLREKDNAVAPSYPKKIERFKHISTNQTFALLGHPSPDNLPPQPMQLDPKVQIFDPKSDKGVKRLSKMKDWWTGKDIPFSDQHVHDKNKVLFDCWVQHGASGSPGIEMDSDGEPVCSLMLICGYPGRALDGKYKVDEEDHRYLLEQGITMKAIAEYLDRMGDDTRELKREIFADNSFK